ncbi:hypothetical protein Salat_2687200 [Sesamum alatum]|uniref:RNase H type-1 domain-containing protein n=1 Tax=Sesamum alatum TaxID=300844 RepID=A0AAE1XQS6_9LAMI|nr:hypothetical protein Salat_2687200 [Sesamum alatum]
MMEFRQVLEIAIYKSLVSRASDLRGVTRESFPIQLEAALTDFVPQTTGFIYSRQPRSDQCEEMVRRNWNSGTGGSSELMENLDSCRVGLMHWDKSTLGNIRKRIKELEERVVKLQNGLQLTEVLAEIQKCKDEVKKSLNAEEVIWKQRAKMDWIKEIAKNTRFFHLCTSTRKKRNHIQKLRNKEDVEAVLAIPLGSNIHDDILIWHFNANGKFLIKSTHHVALSIGERSNASCLFPQKEEGWRFVWNRNTPSRVVVLIRSPDELCIGWWKRHVPFGATPEHIELLAAVEAVKFGKEKGWDRIIVERDCLSVISKLKDSEVDLSALGNLVQDIRDATKHFLSCLFRYVPRDANFSAHNLARELRADFEGVVVLM